MRFSYKKISDLIEAYKGRKGRKFVIRLLREISNLQGEISRLEQDNLDLRNELDWALEKNMWEKELERRHPTIVKIAMYTDMRGDEVSKEVNKMVQIGRAHV